MTQDHPFLWIPASLLGPSQTFLHNPRRKDVIPLLNLSGFPENCKNHKGIIPNFGMILKALPTQAYEHSF